MLLPLVKPLKVECAPSDKLVENVDTNVTGDSPIESSDDNSMNNEAPYTARNCITIGQLVQGVPHHV